MARKCSYLGSDEPASLVQDLLRCGRSLRLRWLRKQAGLHGRDRVHVETRVPAGQPVFWNRHGRN